MSNRFSLFLYLVLASVPLAASPAPQGDGAATAQDSGLPHPAPACGEEREIETYSMIVDQQIGQQLLRNDQERALSRRLRQQAVSIEREQGRVVQEHQDRRAELEAARRQFRIQQQEEKGRGPLPD